MPSMKEIIFPRPYRYASAPLQLAVSHVLALFAGFAILALAVMWWRWGGTVADSLHYFNTARYLRGEVPLEELLAPFPYRLLVPALAAAIPGDIRSNFATLNWLLMSASAVMMALTVLRLGFNRRGAILAGVLLIVCVPTFWYAPYLLVDPGSMAARTGFLLALVSGQPWLAALAAVLGSAVREENIVLLVWLVAARQIAILPGLAALAAAGGWILAVRWYIITGLPHYSWTPSWAAIQLALADTRSLISLALGAGAVLPLALLGLRGAPAQLRPFKSLLLIMALPPLYAALCVRVEGRIIWGLYPMLIPFAIVAVDRLRKA